MEFLGAGAGVAAVEPAPDIYQPRGRCSKGWLVSDDVLLEFLTHGLIDVGGDDAKLEKMRSTAGDLAKALQDSPERATSYALIAFDPNSPALDPVVAEVMDALRKRWATYVNTFAGTPILVVRALLLDALNQAAAADDRIGLCFVASARNALPFMEVGEEQKIWVDVIGKTEDRIDARAEREWATPDTISVPKLSFKISKKPSPVLKTTVVDRRALASQLQAAAGPQSGNVATNGNPTWPQNNPAHWVAEFGARAAVAVADAVDAVTADFAVGEIDVAGPLNQLAEAVTGFVEATLSSFSGATAGLQRRTELLWWKEALYSHSARKSYRTLEPQVAAALMALDLFNQLPLFSPASVAAFLHEAVALLPSAAEAKHSVGDLLATARQSPELAPLRATAAGLLAVPRGRGPLLALIGHPEISVSPPSGEFRDLTGVPAGSELGIATWATWLFRELQAARATERTKPPKRRQGKAEAQ